MSTRMSSDGNGSTTGGGCMAGADDATGATDNTTGATDDATGGGRVLMM